MIFSKIPVIVVKRGLKVINLIKIIKVISWLIRNIKNLSNIFGKYFHKVKKQRVGTAGQRLHVTLADKLANV